MKKLICILLALSAVISMTSCQQKAEDFLNFLYDLIFNDADYMNSTNWDCTNEEFVEEYERSYLELKEYGEELLPQLANIANLSVKIGNVVFDIIIAIVLSVYIMYSKETLIAQLKKALYAVLKTETASNLVRFARESHRIFSGFINGKLLDSLILHPIFYFGAQDIFC